MTANPDPLHYAPWLASRSAGIVAFTLVSAAVLLGLAQSARLVPAGSRGRARDLHEQLAVVALAAVAIHGLALLLDHWLKAGPLDLVVPFHLAHARFWTGLGVIGGWLVAGFVATAYLRRRIGVRRWRTIHRATPVVWALGALHAVGGGSDRGTWWLRVLVIGTAIGVLGLLIRRYVMIPGQAPRFAPESTAPEPVALPSQPAATSAIEPLWARTDRLT